MGCGVSGGGGCGGGEGGGGDGNADSWYLGMYLMICHG